MKGIDNTRQIDRYIALDIHKEYVLAGGQNAKQEWVLPPRRISMTKFREWARANLHEGDAVVIETTTNVWISTILWRRWPCARQWRMQERCDRSRKRG